MKKRKLIRFFLLSFIGLLVLLVLSYKNFKIKSKGPLSWQEIYNDLHVFLIMSFVYAIFMTFSYYANKYGKKEK